LAHEELERYLDDEGLPKTDFEMCLLDDGTEISTANLPTNPDLFGKVWFISKGLFLLFATYYHEVKPISKELSDADSLLHSILIAD